MFSIFEIENTFLLLLLVVGVFTKRVLSTENEKFC